MSLITVVGSINIDLVTRVSRLPREGETISGHSFQSIAGGKGANQAVCAARLGGVVQMVGRLGEDAFAEQLKAELDGAGVDTAGVRKVQGSSGSAVITVTDAGANSIVVVPGANDALTPAALDEHMLQIRDAAILLGQMETPTGTAERLGLIAAELGKPFMLDPAPAQHVTPAVLRHVTWLTPNESETCTLLRALGIPWGEGLESADLARAAEHLLGRGPRNVILKLGERGVYMMGKDVEPTLLSAPRVKAVDTTAAGDAFNGGFAFALTAGKMTPRDAARFACAVAAVSVTRMGAQKAMPTYDEANALLQLAEAVNCKLPKA